MDTAAVTCQITFDLEGKVERDNSFKARESEESGIYSSEAGSSLNSDWEFYENEVLDASVFSLPDYIQSSNLKAERPEAEFSTISGDASVPNGQGMPTQVLDLIVQLKLLLIFRFRSKRVNSYRVCIQRLDYSSSFWS